MTEPQEGATYAQLLAVARRAEDLGFEAFFRSDHYTSVRFVPDLGSTDAWATLAGLARDTSRIRLGTLMSPITWRHPAVLAKTVTTVDEMSGGRVEMGIGTGWQPVEHQQYGFPFETIAERFVWVEEALQIITGLWTQERTTVEGTHFSVTDAQFWPKPVQKPHPPILMGGAGPKKTPRLVAKYAQEWNGIVVDPETYAARRARVVEACERIGRDPATVTYSMMTGVLVGADKEDFERRASLVAEHLTGSPDYEPFVENIRRGWIVGTPEEATDRLNQYSEAGCERVMLQMFALDDLDHLDVIWNEVRPKLGG